MTVGTHLVTGGIHNEHVRDDFQCLILCQHTPLYILFIQLSHVLVETAVTEGMPVAFNHLQNMHHIAHLYSFIKASGPLFHHGPGHMCYNSQLLSSLFILLMLRHFLRQLGKALKEQQSPFQ